MTFPDKKTVDRVRAEYPPGTFVSLVRMDDPQAPPPGMRCPSRRAGSTRESFITRQSPGFR